RGSAPFIRAGRSSRGIWTPGSARVSGAGSSRGRAWMENEMKRVLIIGAASAIAEETARLLARQGASLFLVGRNAARLSAIAEDLKVRGATWTGTMEVDLLDFGRHPEIYAKAGEALGSVDLVLVAHGTLGDQKKCEADYALAEKE